jgi:hypothetical protein
MVWRSSSLGCPRDRNAAAQNRQPPHRAVLSGTRTAYGLWLAPSRDRLDGLEPLTSAFGSVEIGPMLDKGPRGACQRMRPVGRDPVVLSWCCQLVLRIRLRRRAAWTRTALIMPKHGFKADAAVGDEADPGNLCRAAHNPEVAGSNPARYQGQRPFRSREGPSACRMLTCLPGRAAGRNGPVIRDSPWAIWHR